MMIYSMPSRRAMDDAKAIEPIKAELEAAKVVITQMYAKRGEHGAEWARKLAEQFHRNS